MSILGEPSIDRRVRKLEQEAGDNTGTSADTLQRQINDLETRLVVAQSPTTPTRQGIDNMLRNTDHPHSVNTWWETAVSGTDKDKECANVYAYHGFNAITINDASIAAASTDLVSPSGPFTAAMTGRYAIVPGAGVAGADLVAVMTYVSPTHCTLSIAATLAVGPVTARINLLKLTHTNKLNAAATNPSDALKDASHSNYGSNIQDPDWDKNRGIVRIGSTNTSAYPFGRFDNTGLIYVPLHQLFAGREPFFRVNIARANPYVKIPGRLFIGIYNNNPAVLDWVKGSNLVLSPALNPDPAPATVSTDYMVVLETGQGLTIVSDVLTIANAPTDAAMSGGAIVHLAWTYYAGVISATVYRRRTGGNVFKMETFSTGSNTWTDTNLSTRVDTASAAFPTFANQVSAIPSYWASSDHEFDDLLYDGQPDKFWRPITGRLPFSPSVNMAKLFDPHFVIGLTLPLSTYLTDVVTDGTVTVSSAAGQFVAAHTGKTYVLTAPDGSASVTGIITFVDPNTATVSVAPSWTATGGKLEILDSQPHGLLYDLVGCSLNEGEWNFNPEDNSELRGQPVASSPNGSTQGGTGGQGPTDGGGRGGIDCVLDSALVSVRGTERTSWIWFWINVALNVFGRMPFGKWRVIKKRAIDVEYTDKVWSGLGYEDDSFNEIEWISVKEVGQISWLLTDTKELPCTSFHRVVDGIQTFKWGIAVGNLTRGRFVLISDVYSARVETVLSLRPQNGRFRVVSFGLKQAQKPTANLLVINDFVSHNLKRDDVIELN